MSNRLLFAVGLLLVIEGLLPFVAPALWRDTFRRLIEMTDGQLRFVGLMSLVGGLAMLFAFRQ